MSRLIADTLVCGVLFISRSTLRPFAAESFFLRRSRHLDQMPNAHSHAEHHPEQGPIARAKTSIEPPSANCWQGHFQAHRGNLGDPLHRRGDGLGSWPLVAHTYANSNKLSGR